MSHNTLGLLKEIASDSPLWHEVPLFLGTVCNKLLFQRQLVSVYVILPYVIQTNPRYHQLRITQICDANYTVGTARILGALS